MICGIYKIQNNINNKVYIGQSEDIDRRWMQHRYGKGNKHLRSSFLKYGLLNFTFDILEELSNDKTTLTEREQHWIDFYQCWKPGFGYNKNKSAKPNTTKKRDDDFGKKISKIKRENYHTGKKVNQYTLSGDFIQTWPAASEASRKTGIHSRTILSCCSGRQHQSGGFIWKHHTNTEEIKPYVKEKIIQYNLNGIVIKTYNSVKNIIEVNPCYNLGNIAQCVRGEQNIAHSYIWLPETTPITPEKLFKARFGNSQPFILTHKETRTSDVVISMVELRKVVHMSKETIKKCIDGQLDHHLYIFQYYTPQMLWNEVNQLAQLAS